MSNDKNGPRSLLRVIRFPKDQNVVLTLLREYPALEGPKCGGRSSLPIVGERGTEARCR